MNRPAVICRWQQDLVFLPGELGVIERVVGKPHLHDRWALLQKHPQPDTMEWFRTRIVAVLLKRTGKPRQGSNQIPLIKRPGPMRKESSNLVLAQFNGLPPARHRLVDD